MALEQLLQQACIVERAWGDAWASLGAVDAEPHTIADDTANYVRVYTPGAREMLLNIVLCYTAPAPVSTADIEQVIAPYRHHRLPFQWWLTLDAQPEGLRERLYDLGMQSTGGATSMTLSLREWKPDYAPIAAQDYALHAVLTPEDAIAALRVICQVFFVPREPMARWTTENPLVQVYVAYLAGQPAAALATVRHDNIVGIYHVATLPFARRRGLAGNLLILALHDAAQAGCTLATLTATPEARPLYEHLGFHSCGVLEQWVPGHQLTRSLVYGPPSLFEQATDDLDAF